MAGNLRLLGAGEREAGGVGRGQTGNLLETFTGPVSWESHGAERGTSLALVNKDLSCIKNCEISNN